MERALKRTHLDIIFDSQSNYTPEIADVVEEIGWMAGVTVEVHEISWFHHPFHLLEFADKYPLRGNRWVICCGSNVHALPGMIRSWFDYYHKDIPVVGVALYSGEDDYLRTARSAISLLPGKPVLMELNAHPYAGPEGLREACIHAITYRPPKRGFQEPPPCNIGLTPKKARELFIGK